MAGREKRSIANVMRSRLWVSELVRVAGIGKIYGLNDYLDVETIKSIYKYSKGTSVASEIILRRVDAALKTKIKDSKPHRSFFEIGPVNNDGEHIPLWDALDGSMEAVWAVLVRFDPPIELGRRMGEPFLSRIVMITHRIFPFGVPAKLTVPTERNLVAESYENGECVVDLELITAVIAAWRFAHFIGDSHRLLNYIMIGLLEKAIPDLLQPYGIYEDLKQFLIEQDFINLTGFINAVKSHSKRMQHQKPPAALTYIVRTKLIRSIFYKQPAGYQDFHITMYRHTYVCSYLNKCKELMPEIPPMAQAAGSQN